MMRKILPALTLAAVAAFAAPALAEPDGVNPNYGSYYAPGAVAGGAVVGTAVGVGLYNGWLGSSAAVAAAPTTAAGAAAVGGVAGVGTIALIDAAVQPCRGFQAMFLMNREECGARQQVADGPRRRVIR